LPAADRTSLADALFTSTQQRLLGLLFGQPGRSFYANELITLTGGGSGAVQSELARLARSGLVVVRLIGRQKHYQANPDLPNFAGLCGIASKTMGLAEPLRQALAPVASHIRAAFVYGSVAKRQDTSASDIDLMQAQDPPPVALRRRSLSGQRPGHRGVHERRPRSGGSRSGAGAGRRGTGQGHGAGRESLYKGPHARRKAQVRHRAQGAKALGVKFTAQAA
jgi:hypothetical protein